MDKYKVLSEKELAGELGLSPWTVRSLRLQEGLPHIKTAGRVFYRLATVHLWFEEKEQASMAKMHSNDYGKLRQVR